MKRADIIERLQTEILRLEGFRPSNSSAIDLGLGPLRDAFPNKSFPLGAVHEFLSPRPEDIAATTGFIAGLLAPLMERGGTSLWISSSSTPFPPALKSFGVQPDRIIFLDLKSEKDILWAIEESLKCNVLSAVVGEISEVSFITSRRFQLAVEQSRVTGFILRRKVRKLNTTACVSRWKISPLPSVPMEDLPGIGFPRWKVELLRMRNGRAGIWEIKWMNGMFHPVYQNSDDLATANPGYAPLIPAQVSLGETLTARDALALKAG